MNTDETLSNLFLKLEKWIIIPLQSDVRKRVSRNQFIPFVALSVLIDNLASIRYLGEMPDTKEKSQVGRRYRRFIKEYMPSRYKKHAHLLYEGFRCKLVHKFQLEHFDIRQTAESRLLHLTEVENGNICLNAQQLLKDVIYAFRKLRKDMLGVRAKQDIVEAFSKAGYRAWTHTG